MYLENQKRFIGPTTDLINKALLTAETVGRAATTQACPSEWLGHLHKRLPVTNSKGA